MRSKRLLRFYHLKGYDIIGIDFISVAIEKLKKIDSSLKVKVGDISNLEFEDETFNYVLAFGLYHNFEHNLDKSIAETFRVLKSDGQICASFRADNFQTKITDWLERNKIKQLIRMNFLFEFKMNLKNLNLKILFTKHDLM